MANKNEVQVKIINAFRNFYYTLLNRLNRVKILVANILPSKGDATKSSCWLLSNYRLLISKLKYPEERGWDAYKLISGNRPVWLAMNSYHIDSENSPNDRYAIPHE